MIPQTTAHILMVDNEEEIRHVVKVLLESEGFTVTEAASGEEALAKFTPDMDLVILDVKMSGISGYQVCLRLRERWNVPILFLTAKTQDFGSDHWGTPPGETTTWPSPSLIRN